MKEILLALERGDTVVTATGRQARHLRWRFDERQRRSGLTSWHTAEILPLASWLEQGWEASLVAGGKAGELTLLSDAQSWVLWRRILTERGDGQPGLPGPGAARLLQRAWRLAREWGLGPRQLRDAASTPDQQAFAHLAEAYVDALRLGGWLDPGVLPWLLADDWRDGRVRPPSRVRWLGFEGCTPRLDALLQGLQMAGCESCSDAPLADAGAARSLVFGTREQELDTLARHLAQHLADNPDAVLGLVLPAPETDGPRVRAALLDLIEPGWRNRPGIGLPVTLPRGRSLKNTGPVHAALLMVKLARGRLDYRDLGQLLRSPYLGDYALESGPRAQLDRRLRDERQRDLSLAELLAIPDAAAPLLFSRLAQVQTHLRTAGQRRDPGAWSGWIEALLNLSGWPGDRELAADEAAAVDDWQSTLGRFAATGPVAGPMSLGGAQGLLTRLVADQDFQPEASCAGVQILSPGEALGHRFDALWVAALDSEAWPPAAVLNPLLPLRLLRQAGHPAASTRQHGRRSGQILDRLLWSTPGALLSYAREVEHRQCTASPAWSRLPRLLPDELPRLRRAPERDALQWRGELEALSHDPPPPLAPGERTRGGSRLLQLQAACPARAFFELRLGARELPVPDFGISAAVRGQVTHRALQKLYEALKAEGLKPGSHAAAAQIPVALADALGSLLRSGHPLLPVFAELERQRLTLQLTAVLALEAERPGFDVQETEAPLNLRLGELDLRLRLDRLDALETGGELVIDYKTGQKFSPTAWLGPRLAEPQLPLYALGRAVTGIAVLQVRPDGIALRGVAEPDPGIHGIVSPEKFAGASWADLVAEWRRDLEALAAEFAAGSCQIDAAQPAPADGQYAPLTRLHDVLRETLP